MTESHFHRDMARVQEDLLKMGGLVEEAIHKATRALMTRDSKLAREVIKEDRRINLLENQIEDACIKLVATQQPVAVDLRFLSAAMKICTFLERMGDQAVNLAERAEEINEMDPMDPPITLRKMADMAQEMARKSLDAFVQGEVYAAYEVCCQDDELDELNNQLLDEMLVWMMKEQRPVIRGVKVIISGRHLERIGDEATNICEEVVFLVEGRVIRHKGAEIREVVCNPESEDQGNQSPE